jgi:hypothetical protein
MLLQTSAKVTRGTYRASGDAAAGDLISHGPPLISTLRESPLFLRNKEIASANAAADSHVLLLVLFGAPLRSGGSSLPGPPAQRGRALCKSTTCERFGE